MNKDELITISSIDLNLNIWNSFSSNTNGFISINEMTPLQLDELNRIDKYIKYLISHIYDKKTRLNEIKKTPYGFLLNCDCPKSGCLSNWIIKLDTNMKEITIMCRAHCDCSIEDELFDECLKDIQSERPLGVNIWMSFLRTKKTRFIKAEMSQTQLNEINYIDNLFEERLTKMGFKTKFQFIDKSPIGYNLERKCQNCNAKWYLNITVPSGEGFVTGYNECDNYCSYYSKS